MIGTIVKKNLIYKFRDLVDNKSCDKVLDFYLKNSNGGEPNDMTKLPWHEDDIIFWPNLKNSIIKNEIEAIRNVIIKCVKISYNEEVYPHLSSLVMWKEGRYMDIHKDNGYESDKEQLHMRKYSAVFYINDDYEGGETIVLKENSIEPLIKYKAKKNSLLIFKSDESCMHGVNKITKGNRLTFAMWFTTDKKYIET